MYLGYQKVEKGGQRKSSYFCHKINVSHRGNVSIFSRDRWNSYFQACLFLTASWEAEAEERTKESGIQRRLDMCVMSSSSHRCIF